MKRIIYILLMLLITASLALPSIPASADQDGNKAVVAAAPTLIIKAAGLVETSQPLPITIYTKYGRETVEGAAVYAVRTDDVVITADSNSYSTLLKKYEELASAKGILLGTSGNDGKLTATLTQTGRYLLVATLDGYIPGFARLTVTLAAQRALNIKNPGLAVSGQPVTITVTTRYSRQPVSGVALYAQQVTSLSTPFINAIPRPVSSASDNSSGKDRGKPIPVQVMTASRAIFNAAIIKADPADTTAARKYAGEVKTSGIFLGSTDDNGNVIHTFNTGGYYILTAILDGYAPGFGRITITGGHQKLALSSPASAATGTSVTFSISDSGTAAVVPGASLWALHTNDIRGTDESIWKSLVDNKAISDVMEKYKGWAREKGKLIGTSDASGIVNYIFEDAGTYLLVAIKDGYTPGFGRISISKENQQSRPKIGLKATTPAYVNKPVILKAFDKKSGQAVDNATVYGFKGWPLPPMVRPSPVTTENGTASAMIVDASAAGEISPDEAGKLLIQSHLQPMLIGTTGSNGELEYTFTEAAVYTVVAFKEGYVAGGCRINVLAEPLITTGLLEIRIEVNMTSGQASTINVVDKSTMKPIAKAAIYVLRTAEIDSLMLKNAPAFVKPIFDANSARTRGSLAGYTDANGNLKWSSQASGQFIVAAFKNGYQPAFTTITLNPTTTNTDN